MDVDREEESDGEGGEDEESMPVYIIVPVSNNSLSFRLLRESDGVQGGRADSTTSDNSRHVLNETRSTRASYGDTPSSYSLVAKDLNLHNADCPYVRWCRASELLMTDDDLRKELINSSRQDLMEISGESASLFEVRIEPNVRAAENDGPGSVRHYVDAQRNMLADNRNEAARQCKCPRAKLIQDPTVSSTSPETEPIESDEEDLDDVDYE